MSEETKSKPARLSKVGEIFKIPIEHIILNEDNIRNDYGDLEELMLSLVESGQLVAARVKKIKGTEKYKLVDGHRRFKAILLGIERGYKFQYLNAQVFTGSPEQEVLTMLTTGTGQKALDPYEIAEGINRLMNFGYAIDIIARKIGKSVSYVNSMKDFLSAPQEVKNMVKENQISTGTVVKIVRKNKETPEKIVETVKTTIENAKADSPDGSTKRATDRHIPSDTDEVPVKPKPKDLHKILSEISMRLEEGGIDNEKTQIIAHVLINYQTYTVEQLMEAFL